MLTIACFSQKVHNRLTFGCLAAALDECIISIQTTLKALRNIKTNKASGPDNIPAWVLKDHAALLAPALTAIFNCSLRKVNFQMNGRWLILFHCQKSIHQLQFIRTFGQYH